MEGEEDTERGETDGERGPACGVVAAYLVHCDHLCIGVGFDVHRRHVSNICGDDQWRRHDCPHAELRPALKLRDAQVAVEIFS